jgi:peptidoglycan hydrolase-like protein with peptidoglycan-binding domain
LRPAGKWAPLIALASIAHASPSFGENCSAIVPTVDQPKYASDYPIPLSLRRNLVFIVARALTKEGEYSGPIDGVYHTELEAAVKHAQKRLGEPETGCLTWTLVDHYAPKQ